MKITLILLLGFCLLSFQFSLAQDSLSIQTDDIQVSDLLEEYDALAPSRAAFYSAVLPGLGQAYNHSYWKIPIVYGGLGVGVYFYIRNDNQFRGYREAYKRRLAGFEDDEYQGRISDDGLIRAQKLFRKNKEISIFVTILIYTLNIIDANVEAHLRQFNVSDNLSLKPNYEFNEITGKSNYGLSLNFKL